MANTQPNLTRSRWSDRWSSQAWGLWMRRHACSLSGVHWTSSTEHTHSPYETLEQVLPMPACMLPTIVGAQLIHVIDTSHQFVVWKLPASWLWPQLGSSGFNGSLPYFESEVKVSLTLFQTQTGYTLKPWNVKCTQNATKNHNFSFHSTLKWRLSFHFIIDSIMLSTKNYSAT